MRARVSRTTVAQCAHEVRAYTHAVRALQGKPQQLCLVNDVLYWTQGVEQELFCLPLSAQHDEEADTHTHHHDDDDERARRVYTPRRVIVDAHDGAAAATGAPRTREEELLRERTRSQVSGITSFRVRAHDGAVFFVRGVRLYVYYTRGPRAGQAPLDVFAYAATTAAARRGDEDDTATTRAMLQRHSNDTDDDTEDGDDGGSRHNKTTAATAAVLPADKPYLYIQHVTSTRRGGDAVCGGGNNNNNDDEHNEAAQLTTVGFVCDHNVYVAHITECATADAAGRAATAVHTTTASPPPPPLRVHVTRITHIGDAQHECGVAEYIVQEEFARLSGYVLSPHHVLYSYTDMSRMRQVTLLDGSAMAHTDTDADDDKKTKKAQLAEVATTTAVETMSYPRVGDDNARCTLVVYERPPREHMCSNNNNSNTSSLQQKQQRQRRVLTREALAAALPSFDSIEYLPRFGLLQDDSGNDSGTERVYVSVLDRAQTSYAVLSCPVTSLPCVYESDLSALYNEQQQQQQQQHDDDNNNADKVGSKVRSANTDAAAATAARLSAARAPVPGLRVELQQTIPWAWVEVPPGPPIHYGVDYDVVVRHACETATAHYHLYIRAAHNDGDGDGDDGKTATRAWRALTVGEWNVRPGSVCVTHGRRHNNDNNDKRASAAAAAHEQHTTSRVTFIANAHGRLTSVLYTLPLCAPTVRSAPHSRDTLTRLSPLDEHVYSFCVSAAHVCYVASTPTRPAQLYVSRLDADDVVATRVAVRVAPWLPAAPPGFLAASAAATAQASTTADNNKEDGSGSAHSNDNNTDRTATAISDTAVTTTQPSLLPLVTPTVVTVRSRRGCALSAHVFASPSAAAASSPAPLALFVYGGPHVQLVTQHDYDAACRATVQVLLQHGIHVAVADNQMSNANGLRELSVCKRNMGGFETSDYVDVVRALCNGGSDGDGDATSPSPPAGFCVDAARVAIFGWSYGGYATLLAMCQAPDTFAMGFAGAPVGDWRLYDTGYTERYMGLLYDTDEKESGSSNSADNSATATGDPSTRRVSRAYRESCIAYFAHGFPDEANRLYIAHGMLDENVHLAHTCHVIDALVAAYKPYAALLYPGERHGLRKNANTRIHHEAMLVHIMSTYL